MKDSKKTPPALRDHKASGGPVPPASFARGGSVKDPTFYSSARSMYEGGVPCCRTSTGRYDESHYKQNDERNTERTKKFMD